MNFSEELKKRAEEIEGILERYLPREEGFQRTVLEAMNTHTPILLRDLDIYPDILFDFYLKAADVDGFEAEIRRLQTDRTYAAAAAARTAKGADFYSRDHVAAMWREFYNGILSK